LDEIKHLNKQIARMNHENELVKLAESKKLKSKADDIGKVEHTKKETLRTLIREIKVKDQLISDTMEQNKVLLKQLTMYKAILRTPRMYTELQKATFRVSD